MLSGKCYKDFFILHSSYYFVIWWYGFTLYANPTQLVVLVLLLTRVYHSSAVMINIFICMGHELRFCYANHFLTNSRTCCEMHSSDVLGNSSCLFSKHDILLLFYLLFVWFIFCIFFFSLFNFSVAPFGWFLT